MPATSKLKPAAKKAGTRTYQAQAVGRFTRDNFGALEPAKLVGIMATAQRNGDLEQLADLFSYVQRTDPHVRSVISTRINAVAGAEIVVEPGPHRPEDKGIAEDAAGFITEARERIEEWEDRFADLLQGVWVGIGALENIWRPQGGIVWGDFGPILSRDIRYRGEWRPEARTYTNEAGEYTGVQRWVDLRDEPNKFTINAPRNISERPTMTGEVYPILWPWLFKRWVEKFGLEGFGKLANGLLFSVLPENAEDNLVSQRLSELECLSTDGSAVFKMPQGSAAPVELLEAGRDPGTTAKILLDYYNNEISKSVLGSGLNVEVGNTGGNRALGESQFATTILPRLKADAKRALGALQRDWTAPQLAFNRHLFGGRMPPVPIMRAVLVDEAVESTAGVGMMTLAVQAGVVTKDQLLATMGLDPMGPDRGGNDIATLPLPGVPEGAAPFAVAPEDEPKPEGRPRISHEAGGEWCVHDASGKVVDVYARKADAVEALRELLANPEGTVELDAPEPVHEGGAPPRPKAQRRRGPEKSRQTTLRFSGMPRTSLPTHLRRALLNPSDDPQP